MATNTILLPGTRTPTHETKKIRRKTNERAKERFYFQDKTDEMKHAKLSEIDKVSLF